MEGEGKLQGGVANTSGVVLESQDMSLTLKSVYEELNEKDKKNSGVKLAWPQKMILRGGLQHCN